MDREDLLVVTAILLFAQGYLFINIIPPLIGIGILIYLLSIKVSFNADVTIELLNKKFEVNEGEGVDLIFKIKNNSKIPLKLKIKEWGNNFKWYVEELFIDKNEEKRYKVRLIPKKKGRFEIENFIFTVFDVNRIFFKDVEVEEKVVLDVYPSIESLKNSIKRSRNIKIGKEILTALKIGYESLEFGELREYFPGDDYKHVDWKRTAKFGYLIVRDFLREKEGNVHVLVDVSNAFRKSKTDYLSLLVYYLIGFLNTKNKNYKIVIFDDLGVKKVYENLSLDSGKKYLEEFLKGLDGIPNLRIYKEKSGVLSHIPKLIEGGEVILITDVGLRFGDIIVFVEFMKKRGINTYIISLNPLLFLGEKYLNEDNIPKIYDRFIEREVIVKKLNILCPTVDLGPNDLVELAFKRGGK
ncbi:DUF58 domain-containing protein [Methanotorris formicicus]|uniref:DUF58 domain-containing protein n=1 Tax=Methanotorris formicicus Mc-S-70 TaxID=647171 RepID=H1KXE5_9EURY|nr:DUF58 domain-containing protein [Methanotorris formicicus]EHP88357.1 protein of unknown function DUF58 [Methanotorris formicicus Mc-S-70]